MIVYIICFSVSTLFAFIAQQAKSKKLFVFYSTISIGVIALLAGLRDYSIGIDTISVYGNTWTIATRSRSLWSFMELYHKHYRSMEYFYALLIGICAKTIGNYHFYMTLVHIIIVGGVYIGAFRLRKFASPSFTLLIFYLLYFNHSLNIFRQYMAMAILFAGVKDVLDNHHRRFLLTVVIAVLFHNTAILGLLYLVLYRLLYPEGRMKAISFNRRVALFVIIIIGVFTFAPVVQYLIRIGIISEKYSYYFVNDGTNTYLVARVLVAFELLLLLIYLRPVLNSDSSAHFFVYCTFVFAVLYQIAPSLPFGKRIPAYFSLINISTIGFFVSKLRERSNRIIIRTAVILISLIYWVVMYGYYNVSQTVPYILGI